MKKTFPYKKVILVLVSLLFLLSLTGCATELDHMVKYVLRPSPRKVMKRYLEEKYDDKVKVVKYETGNSFNLIWDEPGFGIEAESSKYPGKIVSAGYALESDMWHYELKDHYLCVVYLDEMQELARKEAKGYFTEECLIYAYPSGNGGDNENDPVRSFDEFVREKKCYGICIFIEGMSDEEAFEALEKYRAHIEELGITCDYTLGKNVGYTREEFERILFATGDFDPWFKEKIEWLYRHGKKWSS